MDMTLFAPKQIWGALVVLALLTTSSSADSSNKNGIIWDSGYDSFCGGACLTAYRSDEGAILEFVDPADGTTKFLREISLPQRATIGIPRVAGVVDIENTEESTTESYSAITSGNIPPPPAGGTGAVYVQAPIYDGQGHVVGTVVIYYFFENGALVDIQVDTEIIINHGHVER